MAYLFLSYLHEDGLLVDRLVADLRSQQVEVWLDRERISPGQRWRHAIRSGIQSGALFLACFSRAYAARGRSFMHEELTFAIDELRSRPVHRTWFVPVLLDDGAAVPTRDIGGGETLRDIQWVDLAKDWQAGVAAIVEVARAAVDAFSVETKVEQWADRAAASGVQQDEIDAVLARFSKEARRLALDLRQERERRLLSMRHQFEAELYTPDIELDDSTE